MNKTSNILKHWKLIIHVLLKTNRFGVNNHWWSQYPSCIGIVWYRQLLNILLIYPIIQNYYAMRMRALSGWVPRQQAEKWFRH